jgi:hypothetical protein
MEESRIIILKIRRIAIAVLLIFFCACNQQHKMPIKKSIKGVAVDSNGIPMRDATVMIVDGSHTFTDMASLTNDKGEFYLDNVMLPGSYTIQVMHNGVSVRSTFSLSDTDTEIIIEQ